MKRAAERGAARPRSSSRASPGFLYRGETTLTLVPTQSVIRDAVALVRAEAALCKVEITVAIEAGLIPIHVDTIQIQQVIVNLVRNAIEAITDARTPQRHVHVAERIAGDMVEISVRDTGPGLPPKSPARCSNPSSRPRPRAWGWDWRSVGLLFRRMAAGFGPKRCSTEPCSAF